MSQLTVYDNGFWEQRERKVDVDDFSFNTPNVIVNTDKLNDKAQAILGENGYNRFSEFLQYKDYWDQSAGKKLSLRSVAVLNYFFSRYEGFASEPSLFLTRDGNLQLGWEDKLGKTIEIEFAPDKIMFYLESSDIEDYVDFEEFKRGSVNTGNSLVSQLESIN